MSLVVCSNQDSDSTTATTQQSIYKPYSFRNALSSTYTIPKNGQVALQSCKYNLDGTIPLSAGDQVLYQYFGQTDITSEDPFNDKFIIELNSASVPIRTQIFEGKQDTIEEVTPIELADSLQTAMNKTIMHPNLRDLIAVTAKRDSSTNEFTGYQIIYDQFNTPTSVIPGNTEAIDQMDNTLVPGDGDDGITYGQFTYQEGQFTALADPAFEGPAVGVLASNPLSANGGVLQVDFTNPNNSNRDWGIGLSRYVNHTEPNAEMGTDSRQPSYWISAGGDDLGDTQPVDSFFYDFLVCAKEDVLRVFHTCADGTVNDVLKREVILSRELAYGDSTVPYEYDMGDNSAGYTSVKFVLKGQQLEIYMVKADDSEDTLYIYNAEVEGNSEQLSCVSQAKWNLYPLLYLEQGTGQTYALFVEEFTPCQNETQTLKQRLDDGKPETVSWYNSVEDTVNEGLAIQLENRPWNDYEDDELWAGYMLWAGLEDVTGPIDLQNVLIMRPSGKYTPSRGANTQNLLGFSISPYEDYDADGTLRTFTSDTVPKLLASRSMFLRLENMTQTSMNARQGNRSSIIAHLPRFDGQVETGRIYHEPKNLIFLDLNNSQPMNVSSFDISFVYSNEQYVQALTGQSVVCLYFREKPAEKIQQV